MKNKAWFLLFIILCGSAATVSAFASDDPSMFPGGEVDANTIRQAEATAFDGEREISNDDATRDKQAAVEAGLTCKSDCEASERAECESHRDSWTKAHVQSCKKKVHAYCEKQCD